MVWPWKTVKHAGFYRTKNGEKRMVEAGGDCKGFEWWLTNKPWNIVVSPWTDVIWVLTLKNAEQWWIEPCFVEIPSSWPGGYFMGHGWGFVHQIYVMWGPVYENAKLVNITPITMVYGTQITSDNYTSYGPMGQNSAWSKIGWPVDVHPLQPMG